MCVKYRSLLANSVCGSKTITKKFNTGFKILFSKSYFFDFLVVGFIIYLVHNVLYTYDAMLKFYTKKY